MYIVQKLPRPRKKIKKAQFLVGWKIYDATENAWEDESSIQEVAYMILKEYKQY